MCKNMPIRIIIYIVIALTLSGCLKIYEPDLDFEEAIFHSPKGKFELKPHQRGSILLTGSDGEHPVSISLFPINQTGILRMSSIKNATIKIESSKAYYQLNDGKKINLILKRSLYNINNYNIIAPSTMDYYLTDGDGLHVTRKRKKITKNHIKKIKKEFHHYYIPILINDESYAIDVTYRLKVKYSWHLGIPGTP